MRAFNAAVGFAVLVGSVTATAQIGNPVVMPIDDPKTPADGPYIATGWLGPCRECNQSPELRASFEAAKQAILGGTTARAKLHPRIVRIVSFTLPAAGEHGGYRVNKATLQDVSERIKGCAIGSQSMLRQPLASDLDSFGVRLDCPGKTMPMLMSLSFKDSQLATVFLMPDRPIFAQMTGPAE